MHIQYTIWETLLPKTTYWHKRTSNTHSWANNNPGDRRQWDRHHSVKQNYHKYNNDQSIFPCRSSKCKSAKWYVAFIFSWDTPMRGTNHLFCVTFLFFFADWQRIFCSCLCSVGGTHAPYFLMCVMIWLVGFMLVRWHEARRSWRKLKELNSPKRHQVCALRSVISTRKIPALRKSFSAVVRLVGLVVT